MPRKTQYGGIIALPSFLFATSRIISGYVGGLPGMHAMWSGADWTWHKPVRRNDAISTEACLKDLIEHETRFAGRAVQQIYHVDFFNQHGDQVAEADSWCFRTERDHAREKGTKYKEVRAREPRRYSDAELAELYKLYAKEEVRGGEQALLGGRQGRRGAADDGEGADDRHRIHRLRPGLGRPLHPRQQARVEAHRRASRRRHHEPLRHSRRAPNACTGRRTSRSRWARRARTTTVPSACSWLTHHLTNWMGDDGFLRRASARCAVTTPKGTCSSSRGR